MTEVEILDNELFPKTERRRKLLPIWIKIFLWLFMIFGIIAPVGLILGLLGIDFNLAIIDLETTKGLSTLGIIIITLFSIKGVVSFGLWTEKDWAVNLAIIDGIIGIAVCTFVMLVSPFLTESNVIHFNIRLELIALIPYLIKMKNIKRDWETRK